MPNSFSLMATFRLPYVLAVWSRSLGRLKSLVISIGPTKPLAARRIEVLDLSEVRLNHSRVCLDLLRAPLRDLFAEVQDRDPVGDIHHHAHIVLNQDTRDSPTLRLIDLQYEPGHVLGLLEVQPCHRLIQQNQRGIQGQRPSQLDPLLEPVGQHPDHLIPDVLDLEEVDDLPFDEFAMLDLLPRRLSQIHRAAKQAGLHVDMSPQANIVQNGHAAKELNLLEGTRDPEVGSLVGPQRTDVVAVIENPPRLGLVESTEPVQEDRLPGAVRAR